MHITAHGPPGRPGERAITGRDKVQLSIEQSVLAYQSPALCPLMTSACRYVRHRIHYYGVKRGRCIMIPAALSILFFFARMGYKLPTVAGDVEQMMPSSTLSQILPLSE